MEKGTYDEIFPIEDSMIPLQFGGVKEARYVLSFVVCVFHD